MKKLLSAMLSAVLILSLVSCGGGAEGFDASTIYRDLMETPGVFASALESVDQSTACALYGIDESTVTSCAVYMANATSAEELVILTLTDEEAAQTAAKQLGYRVEDRIEGLTDYLPGEVPKLESAIVETRGNSVLLLVCSDYEAARKVLDVKPSDAPGKSS